jgi:hypothetical protein
MIMPNTYVPPDPARVWEAVTQITTELGRQRQRALDPPPLHLEVCSRCGCLCTDDEVCPNCHPLKARHLEGLAE